MKMRMRRVYWEPVAGFVWQLVIPGNGTAQRMTFWEIADLAAEIHETLSIYPPELVALGITVH